MVEVNTGIYIWRHKLGLIGLSKYRYLKTHTFISLLTIIKRRLGNIIGSINCRW